MGAASGQFPALDGAAAAATGFTMAPVDPGLSPVIAIHSFEISEITKGCSSGANADVQYIHQALVKSLKTAQGKLPRWGERVDACSEKAFIGVDVSDPGYQILVKESGFDRSS